MIKEKCRTQKTILTIKLRAEARVTIQEIKSLGVLQPRHVTKRDVFLFINSKPYWTALLYSLIVQPYCTALLYSLIEEPYCTALLDSLIVQPYCTTLGGFICTFSLLSSLSFTFQSSKFNYSSSSQWQLK